MTARNGSRELYGNVQDGADHPADGAAPVICPERGEAPASVTSQLSLASYAVVTWHRHGKAGQ